MVVQHGAWLHVPDTAYSPSAVRMGQRDFLDMMAESLSMQGVFLTLERVFCASHFTPLSLVYLWAVTTVAFGASMR